MGIEAAIIGAGILGAGASVYGSSKQASASKAASQGTLQQYLQTRSDLAPYMKQGKMSLAQLGPLVSGLDAPLMKSFGMEEFEESPGYQFNLQEGQKAINKAAAARGNYYAPTTLQDISKFSQGLASNEFQTQLQNFYGQQGAQFGRLYGLAGMGQSAANQTGAFGSMAAGQIGQNTMGAGNARAAGAVGAANAIGGAVGDLSNQMLLRDILTRSSYDPNAYTYYGM